MKRWIPFIALGVVALLVVGGAVYLWTGDGQDAYEVNGRAVSQSTIDDELRIFRDNSAFAGALIGSQGPVAVGRASVPWDVTHGWLDYRITTDLAEQELKRRGGSVSAAELDETEQALATAPGWNSLPKGFRDDIVERTATLNAVVRTIAEESGDDLLAAACPSGRFVSHILVNTEAEAAAIKRAIESGTDFATAAQSNSLDGSAQDGGQLGCFDDSQFVEPFATVAATQPIGVLSDPVQTEFGYHLVLTTDQPPAGALDEAAFTVFRGRASDPKFTKVSVADRYGSWDRRNLTVAPPPSPGATPTTQPAVPPTG